MGNLVVYPDVAARDRAALVAGRLLVAEGRDFVAVHPWISLLPGVALAAVVLATHRISTSLRKDHG